MEKLCLLGFILMLPVEFLPARFPADRVSCTISGQSLQTFFMAKYLSKHMTELEKNSKRFNNRTGGNIPQRQGKTSTNQKRIEGLACPLVTVVDSLRPSLYDRK